MEAGDLLSVNWTTIVLGLGSVLFLCLSFVHWRTRGVSISGMPKGSMGWPIIGETMQYLYNPVAFVQQRVKRYGKVFKTHFLGAPTIVVADTDLAAYVLADRRNQFEAAAVPVIGNLWRLLSFNISGLQGESHAVVHRNLLSTLSASNLIPNIGKIEDVARSFLDSYVEEGKPIFMSDETKKFALQVMLALVLDLYKDDPESKMIRELCVEYTSGFVALPINLPGTVLNKALKAKEKINAIVLDVAERKVEKGGSDAENSKEIFEFLRKLEKVPKFTELGSPNPRERFGHLLTDICVAAYDSVSTAITWAIHNLYENPEILKAVTMEHDRIRERKADGENLTWEEIKSMTVTFGVIQETLRLTNVVAGLVRQASEDTEYNGYKIPKGWNVHISNSYFHLDSENYEDAQTFDPSRFQKIPKRNSYLPFGLGGRWCVGSDVAKLSVTVILYHFTLYSSARVGKHSGKINWPFPLPKDNLPIRFYGKKSL